MSDDRAMTLAEWAYARVEAMKAELHAADWCHPSGAAWIGEWLADAELAARDGDIRNVDRLLAMARRKLDTERWWYAYGGSDFPPDRASGDTRTAVERFPRQKEYWKLKPDELASAHAEWAKEMA